MAMKPPRYLTQNVTRMVPYGQKLSCRLLQAVTKSRKLKLRYYFARSPLSINSTQRGTLSSDTWKFPEPRIRIPMHPPWRMSGSVKTWGSINGIKQRSRRTKSKI